MRALVIEGPIAAIDVPLLCERLRSLLAGTDAEVVVDVRSLAADAVTLEALARLQLTARRVGRRISLRRASPDLDCLVSFAGLADVLPACHRAIVASTEREQ
jgi:hypothetical protein